MALAVSPDIKINASYKGTCARGSVAHVHVNKAISFPNGPKFGVPTVQEVHHYDLCGRGLTSKNVAFNQGHMTKRRINESDFF